MRRFRHLRRLTAVVAQLLLLQLAFVSAAGACPLDPSGARTATGTHIAGAGTSHSQHVGDAASPAGHTPASSDSHRHGGGHSDTACAVANCSSAGHCATPAIIVGDASVRPLAVAHDVTASGTDAAPHSVSTAPEPPPPRA